MWSYGRKKNEIVCCVKIFIKLYEIFIKLISSGIDISDPGSVLFVIGMIPRFAAMHKATACCFSAESTLRPTPIIVIERYQQMKMASCWHWGSSLSSLYTMVKYLVKVCTRKPKKHIMLQSAAQSFSRLYSITIHYSDPSIHIPFLSTMMHKIQQKANYRVE